MALTRSSPTADTSSREKQSLQLHLQTFDTSGELESRSSTSSLQDWQYHGSTTSRFSKPRYILLLFTSSLLALLLISRQYSQWARPLAVFDGTLGNARQYWSRWSEGYLANVNATDSPIWMMPNVDRTRMEPSRTLTTQEVVSCLQDKWILFIGDSSTRMPYAAALEAIEPNILSEYNMPQYNNTSIQPPGQDRNYGKYLEGYTPIDNLTAEGYYRDFVLDNRIRMTYIFKTYARTRIALLNQILTVKNQPDLVVFQNGAWDGYNGSYQGGFAKDKHEYMTQSMIELREYTEWMRGYIPNAPILWMDLTTCDDEWTEIGATFNEYGNAFAASQGWPVFHRSIVLADHWQDLQKARQCEGWHAWNDLARILGHGLLNAICNVR